jgi:hypothetical protein
MVVAEYKVLWKDFNEEKQQICWHDEEKPVCEDDCVQQITLALNSLGAQGWGLVGVTPDRLFFQRMVRVELDLTLPTEPEAPAPSSPFLGAPEDDPSSASLDHVS